MKAIQKITAVFLAFVFLLSSFGFTISSMVCVKSGKGKVSFSYIEDCCAKKKTVAVVKTGCCDDAPQEQLPENNSVIKKADCCDINNFTIRLNDFQNAQKLSAEQPVILHSLFISEPSFIISATGTALAYHSSDLPPPRYGRILLNHISTLLI